MKFPPERDSANAPAQPIATDVALIDAPKCAAIGSMGISWWYEEVRQGRAPQPVVRKPRCTRWRLADVLKFWRDFADSGDGVEAA